MKILYVIGQSQYDSTSKFMNEMSLEMLRQGWDVDVLDGNCIEEYICQRERSLNKNYDVIFTINGMLLEDTSLLGKHLLRQETPIYCTYLMDHPMIHYERLKNKYPRMLVLAPDRDHVKYMDKYMSNIYAEAFLPHAGCECQQVVPYQQRTYDVTFMGSYVRPENLLEELNKYPLQMTYYFKQVSQLMIDNPRLTLQIALQTILEKQGISIKQENFAAICNEFIWVDKYVRHIYRDKVIRTLLDAAVHVDVFGDGWEEFKSNNKQYLRVHSSIAYMKSLEIVGNSKISLNVMPWFKDGSHDRVISAMLCGSVCLTDASKWLWEQFDDNKNIYFYSLEKIEDLPQIVKNILCNTERSSQVAKQGKFLAQNMHMWKNRAREIIDYLLEIFNIIQGID